MNVWEIWRKRSSSWPKYKVFNWIIYLRFIKSRRAVANTSSYSRLLTYLNCVKGLTLIHLSEIVRICLFLILCDLEECYLFFDLWLPKSSSLIGGKCTLIQILTFVGPCIEIYFYGETNQMHNTANIFYFGTTLNMFWTVSPSIIRSLRLYIQHQVYVIQVLLLLASKQNKFEMLCIWLVLL